MKKKHLSNEIPEHTTLRFTLANKHRGQRAVYNVQFLDIHSDRGSVIAPRRCNIESTPASSIFYRIDPRTPNYISSWQ